MFQATPIVRGLALAFGGFAGLVVSAAALAQQAPAQAQQKLERIEITGSAIKRVEAETAQPVEVYTKKEIERTGATNLNEFIRTIPSVDIFDQGELSSNSPSGSGTASIRLRGLSESNLLVLLNGRRLPVNALYDASGAGAAVDINMIPISAIERVEILKDGGSAIYGADAVAGVFNIITRRDYQGIEARAGYGQSAYNDGNEYSAGLAFGYGDLNAQKFNVFASLDVFKRDPIYRKDRANSASSKFPGWDGRSSFSPAGNILTPVVLDSKGDYVSGGGFAGKTYAPCAAADLDASGRCRYDFNASTLTAYNGAERYSGMLLGSLQLTPSIRAFGEALYAGSKDKFEAHPVPDYFYVKIKDAADQIYAQDINGVIDPNSDSMYIAGRFMQGGPRTTRREASLINLSTGLDGNSFGVDWKVWLNYGESRVTNKDSNYYHQDKWNAAIAGGKLDPTVTTNDPALVQSLKVNPQREGKSTITAFNLQAGGDAFNLPAGPLLYAVGAQYWRESLTDTPDLLTQQGKVVGSIQQSAADAERDIWATFIEFGIPIVKDLEASAALRYDHYDSASKASPKLGLKWTATKNLLLRGSYTGSFRAPVLKQLYGATEQGAITLNSADECAEFGQGKGCNIPAYQVNGSNPNLKPETAKTFNLGAVVDLGVFSGSLDWWKIQKDDVISAPSIAQALSEGRYVRANGQVLVFTTLQNYAQQEVSGLDFDGKLTFRRTAVGNLTVRNFTTYYFSNKLRDAADAPWSEYNATYAYPRWRNTLVVGTETGPWSVSTGVRTTAGFYDQTAPAPIAASTRRVASHSEVDLQGGYTGVKNLQVTLGIKNLFDRMPPFSLVNASSNGYSQMGFAELYTNRGRFFYGTVAYKFK